MPAPRKITVEAPTVTLAGWDYGNPTAQPMVFLHGMTDVAWSLHPVAEAFAERFHVLNFDLRGHGDSSHPGRYTVAHFVSDLRVVIGELELRQPVLFGHSMGSIITSWFAGTWPDEPSALIMVEGLGPPARFGEQDPAGRRAISRAMIESLVGGASRPPMADLGVARDRLRRAHPGLDERRVEELAELGTRAGPDGGLVWKWDPFVREWAAGFDRERDRRLGLFADVEHREVDAGHMVHFDAPDEVVSLTDRFLRRRLRS